MSDEDKTTTVTWDAETMRELFTGLSNSVGSVARLPTLEEAQAAWAKLTVSYQDERDEQLKRAYERGVADGEATRHAELEGWLRDMTKAAADAQGALGERASRDLIQRDVLEIASAQLHCDDPCIRVQRDMAMRGWQCWISTDVTNQCPETTASEACYECEDDEPEEWRARIVGCFDMAIERIARAREEWVRNDKRRRARETTTTTLTELMQSLAVQAAMKGEPIVGDMMTSTEWSAELREKLAKSEVMHGPRVWCQTEED